MQESLYLAASGAELIFQSQAIRANNLANVNTTGFKADLKYFSTEASADDTQSSISYPSENDQGIDFSPGGIRTTRRPLDMAIKNEGFFSVQAPSGQEAYTRAGNFQLDATGRLITHSGQPVLGNGGPIIIPQAKTLEIADDGTISILPVGEAANSIVVLDRIKLVKPAYNDLTKGDDGLFHRIDGGTEPANAEVKLISGALEQSNVNAVGELTSIIALARQFEMSLKLMNTTEQADTSTQQILDMNA